MLSETAKRRGRAPLQALTTVGVPEMGLSLCRRATWFWIGLTVILYLALSTSHKLVQADSNQNRSQGLDQNLKEILQLGNGPVPVTKMASKASSSGPPLTASSSEPLTNKKASRVGVDEDEDTNLLDDDEDNTLTEEEKHAVNQTNAAESAAFLPEEGSAEKEHSNSLAIFFVLSVMILCIFLIHLILQIKCHYLPESVAIVFLGASIGLFMRLLPTEDVKSVESFSPTMFFLVLLPPIIFESGYNLHKGNFFTNIGSILLFAIPGTVISALIVGGGIYLMGLAEVVYPLNFVQSFAFGSLISAVDPVATVAIFQALDVDPVLNMLVFGESILNDAVAIVLTTTVLESDLPEMASYGTMGQVWHGCMRFFVIFLGSAGIGTFVALISALTLKHVDLYTNPSLEFALMLCFVYLPYALAEGIHLSGIMSILFSGIVMSQYTHFNLSPVTQITMQQTMRTVSFICESCVFAYLGLAIFSFPLRLEPALIIWSIIFILLGRALNIFPLATLCNKFRVHQISKKMMLIMWFSGLRGAIAYALCLHLEFSDEVRKVLVTTTLVVVLFTTIGLGGSTMPLLKFLETKQPRRNRRGRKKEITLSKTKEMGATIDSEHLSELTEEEVETASVFNLGSRRVQGFLYYDVKYIRPFLIRRFTQREIKEGRGHVTQLTNKWMQDMQGSPLMMSESEEEFNQEHD